MMMTKMWGMDDEGCGNADDSGGNNGKVGEGLDDCGNGGVLLPFLLTRHHTLPLLVPSLFLSHLPLFPPFFARGPGA